MDTLQTLPGDDVRQILWRFSQRYDLQMLVQSARQVARGPVARAVASGLRNTHEWTPEKAELLKAFDEAGLTAAFMEPEHGGYIEGPKNLVQALISFEIAWVDAGASTGGMAGNLALSPIHEKGTPEQKAKYMAGAVPPLPGEDRKQYRGAFALTEPIPYVGVETGMLNGKVSVAEWEEGKEPILQVDKRGRFITGMGFANFVTAAVDSADPRIKGSCVVILEEGDPGTYNRGTATKKMVHQLSSTCDPIFSLKVPASRIVGGYTVKDGVIVPNINHGDVIGAVFHRTRVVVGLMTSAKLLSAVEPIIRYQRSRFRGGESCAPGTPRYELGIQTKEDAIHRLVDIWATGEAGASMGFTTARIYDDLQPLEQFKEKYFAEKGISGRAQIRALAAPTKDALEFIELSGKPESERDAARYEALKQDKLVQYLITDAVANVLCPATKLWNTGWGTNMMREAVALMGGYGITEDCPGFLGQKWMDGQLEATYEGPEAVQRRQLAIVMTNELFLAQYRQWIRQLQNIKQQNTLELGAGLLAGAMQFWLESLNFLQTNKDANGAKLYSSNRQGVNFPLSDALCWLLAVKYFIDDILELQNHVEENPNFQGFVNFFADLAAVQALRAAGESVRICTELVYGYATKETAGLEKFAELRLRTEQDMMGLRTAKDRAAQALTQVMIPEALDYPQ
ncbi:MAG: acyl-CoA/acyl-ACP dehydrogenase [Verrucomicrobia bacterium]|nr:acyl-CoA/acyl-ACP dehydrogenase [Verrucomicrobiota bacterium]